MLITSPKVEVKVIFVVVKQLEQLQRSPEKNSEASTRFQLMTSMIPMSYEALSEAGQERFQFIPVIRRE